MLLYLMIIFLIILLIAAVSQLLSELCVQRRKKYKKFVLQNSLCLKELNEINARYQFFPDISFDQQHTYDNENYYDTISCADYLIYQLQYIKQDVSDQIERINRIKLLYKHYNDETSTITQFGRFLEPTGKLKSKILLEYEQIFLKQTYITPTIQFVLAVTLSCSTINGRIYQRKRESFTDIEVQNFISRLNNKRGTFFNDREIWDAICRVERGKVSNKMRFLIYKRDGYRCCKCGVSSRYAHLEIDHIIPISKGGKSTYDNLQTLCHDCNVKKGNKLY